jgi:hypothetical protein
MWIRAQRRVKQVEHRHCQDESSHRDYSDEKSLFDEKRNATFDEDRAWAAWIVSSENLLRFQTSLSIPPKKDRRRPAATDGRGQHRKEGQSQ